MEIQLRRSDATGKVCSQPRLRFTAILVAALLGPRPSLAQEETSDEGAQDPTQQPEITANPDTERPSDVGPGPTTEPIEIVVEGTAPASAASEMEVTGGELMMRPRQQPGDIIEAAPGLISVQHAGGGKANQYFLRGFDIDHGTDLLFTVDRVPVNMPSHGHGQGYADLHFIIPEVISKLTIHKGPYRAEFGDFATAGALEMQVADRLAEGRASFTMGQFGILRALGIVTEPVGDETSVLLAGEVYAQDGPFEHAENLGRVNILGRARHDLSPLTSATLTWMSYSSSWNASGQIPLREVEAGRLDRFGTIDPSEGGATQRHSVSLALKSEYDDVSVEAVVYGIRYDWRLYSNFTFFLEDPINGDEIEQTDARDVLGTDMRTSIRRSVGWATLDTTLGIQARSDAIDNALYHDVQRERLQTRVNATIAQSSAGLYLDELARFFPWLAVRAGVRADRMQVDVEDHLDDPTSTGNRNGGTASAMLVSPKGSLILSPLGWLDMFVNFGRGFHSNDARGATRQSGATDLLVPATGYEVGTRANVWEPLTLTVAAYRLDLDSEQVYVGDAGTTEPSDSSKRYGLETTGQLRLGRWVTADAALTLNRAVYRANEGNAGSVALAPTRTFSGGVAVRLPFGTFGALRVRHIGARPATDDGSITAEGFTVASALVGHRYGPFEVALDVENLFDTEWREVQFATESQLPGEAEPVEEIHFAPGWPRTVRGTLTAYF